MSHCNYIFFYSTAIITITTTISTVFQYFLLYNLCLYQSPKNSSIVHFLSILQALIFLLPICLFNFSYTTI